MRPVPGTSVRVDVRIGRLGERTVDLAPIPQPGGPIHGGPGERMPEDDLGAERQQALRFDGSHRRLPDAKGLSGTSDQRRIADRVGRRDEQEAARIMRQVRQPSREALLDARGQGHAGRQPEAARELRRRQPARELEQRQRIAAASRGR